MKSLLPDAIFVGFTGTPFLKTDKKQSVEVFGGFIHTYKFNEAVKDGAVRTIKLTCKPNIRANAWRFIGQLQYRNCRHMVESGTRKKKPPECLEYVVVHELIHLLERRHNARFMAHMDDFLPNWQIIK